MIRTGSYLCLLAALLALLAACGEAEPQELPPVSLVVTNGTVIDGTGAEPIENGLVAIDGKRIVAVGRAADFAIPAQTAVIDAGGGTILPGIFNAHAHKVSTVGTRRVLFLLDGVTSVCDLGAPIYMMDAFEEEGIGSGPAARGFKAGSMITAPGGYGGYYFGPINYEIVGAEEAQTAVRDLHARGADYIKSALEPGFDGDVLPVISLEELQAVVAAAHDEGLLVRVHVMKSDWLDIALEAGGVDVTEHVPMPAYWPDDLAPLFDEAGALRMPPELEAQLLGMVEQEIVLVPTLDVYYSDPYWDEYRDPETDAMDQPFLQSVLGVVRFFHDAGGTVAAGNDYGISGVDPGMPLDELKLLQAAGLSPLEVIEAATRNAAYVCGHGDELGTLEEGKLADLIVVDGDPLADLDVMDAVLFVVKDGEVALTPEP